MNAHWWRRIEANGKWEEDEGIMDEFTDLVGNGLAQVEMGTDFGLDFATVKVRCSVRIVCNQDAATINEAAKRAFFKSMELASDGLSHAIPQKDKILKELYGGG